MRKLGYIKSLIKMMIIIVTVMRKSSKVMPSLFLSSSQTSLICAPTSCAFIRFKQDYQNLIQTRFNQPRSPKYFSGDLRSFHYYFLWFFQNYFLCQTLSLFTFLFVFFFFWVATSLPETILDTQLASLFDPKLTHLLSFASLFSVFGLTTNSWVVWPG